MIIFLDMDGVMCDAHRAFCEVLGRPEVLDDWPAGTFSVHEATGMPEDDMWRVVDAAGSKLWSEMPELPWARKLYDDLSKLGDVKFLTSPSWDPQCLAGKLEWLQRFTGKRDFRDFAMTNQKYLLAARGRVLVDDMIEHCEQFIAAGGDAITFPAFWQGFDESAVWKELRDGVMIQIEVIAERLAS